MSTEEYPFLPLYFDEDEEELWAQLQKLPPRERVQTVKRALQAFFESQEVEKKALAYRGEESVNHVETEAKAENNVKTHGVAERPVEEVVTNGLSLKDLFVQTPTETPTPPNPLKNLFSIIGEEEDEEVLEFFRGTGK